MSDRFLPRSRSVGSVLILAGLMLTVLAACDRASPDSLAVSSDAARLRLFWVNSYHADAVWSLAVQQGFSATLTAGGFAPDAVEWGTYALEATPQTPLTETRRRADAAIAAIQSFAPQIVVVSDNAAAQAVIPHYPDPNQRFVYCGLLGDPRKLALNRPNTAGVVEAVRPVETVALAYAFLEKKSARYLLLSDAAPESQVMQVAAQRALSATATPPAAVYLAATWWDWQRVLLGEAHKVDFVLIVGTPAYMDAAGRPFTLQEIMAWSSANSPAPLFGLTHEVVAAGAVAGLTISGYTQGAAAGDLVLRILQGAHPSSIAVGNPAYNRLVMNWVAARRWNLYIPMGLPLAAEVYGVSPQPGGGLP